MSDVETQNDFLIGARGQTLVPLLPVQITTRQQAYRTAAWIALMGDLLPDEDLASTYDEVLSAVRNT